MRPTLTVAYQLCTSCAVAVAYADMSALDTESTAQVLAFMAETGYLVPAEDIDPPGQWPCEACGVDQLGRRCPGRGISPAVAGARCGRARPGRCGRP